MTANRSSVLGGALVGAIVLATLIGTILHFQPRQSLLEQFAAEATKIDHLAELRLALATAAQAEKSAVLATADEESIRFADQARAATAAAEHHRVALGELLQASGTAKEKESLAAFATVFSQLQRVDQELLALAVRNSNLKATALAFGPCAETIHAIDAALSHLIATQARSSAAGAKRVILLAAGAQAAVLRIQALLPPHIAEQNDAKMDALEVRMREEEEVIGKALDALVELVGVDDADLTAAKAGYARLGELKAQIVKLSRENTNVRSLSISLNEKRRVTVACEEALATLAQAIDEARPDGARRTPQRAR